jgi:OmpR-family two-component system manganese-sensing response regulator
MSKVLIVEDDKDLNRAYGQILNHFGYQIETAFNGQEALKKSPKFKPDLILLDLLMPIMGGLDFLKQFKKDKGNKARVLIFTNMENSPEVNEAYELGAHRCVIKSWADPQNINRLVSDALAGAI